jgi:hypothetical protein
LQISCRAQVRHATASFRSPKLSSAGLTAGLTVTSDADLSLREGDGQTRHIRLEVNVPIACDKKHLRSDDER